MDGSTNSGDGDAPVPSGVKKRSYTSRSCLFCQKRHIKCDGLPVCHQCQRRGLQCEYVEKTTRRGPKPGSSRDAKQKVKKEQVAKILEELDRQKQLSEYWRNKYFELQSFACSIIKDPHSRLMLESTITPPQESSESQAGTQQEQFLAQPRCPIIYDVYEWYVYNVTPPHLCEPFDSFEPAKMADGALVTAVLAHGSRLRANEEKAQFFASKVDQMLRTIINSPNSISSAAMATVVLSTILLQIVFHGGTINVDSIKWLLDQAISILSTFKGSIDPLLTQRVYLHLVATRPTAAERWSLFESAVSMDAAVDRSTPNIIREAFFLSNRAVMCLVFSFAIDWYAIPYRWFLDGASSLTKTAVPPQYLGLFTKYLDDTELSISAYENLARSAGRTYHNEDLLNAYRVIVASTRAALFLMAGGDIGTVLMLLVRAMEACRSIPLPASPPILAATIAFVNVVKMLKLLKQQSLYDEGVAMLVNMSKYYPMLGAAVQLITSNTPIVINGRIPALTPTTVSVVSSITGSQRQIAKPDTLEYLATDPQQLPKSDGN